MYPASRLILAFVLICLSNINAMAAESRLKLLMSSMKAGPEDVICFQCHSDLVDRVNYIHYPTGIGACSYCHIARPDHLEGENPPGSVTINRTAENCYVCHDRKDEGPIKHSAMNGAESCLRCHNAHSSYTRYLLNSDSVLGLCTGCHNIRISGKSQHGPVFKGQTCILCHTPHSGTEKKLLRKPSKQLCLSCHNKDIKATMNDSRIIPNIQQKLTMSHIHPGAEGNCLDCHTPHTSANKRLLVAPWSTNIYNLYSETNNPYAICFTCHDSSMLRPSDFVTATQFRDDPKKINLHWFHVVDAVGNEDKTRGRACKICHDPHGAPQTHDINSVWFMNTSPITLEYQAFSSGGQCTKSCHTLKTYQRL